MVVPAPLPQAAGLDPAIVAAIIGAFVTVLTAVLGAIIVVLQLGRQSKDALEQSRHDERLRLKLKVYERVIEACQQSSDAQILLASAVRLFTLQLDLCVAAINSGGTSQPPLSRWPDLERKHSEAIFKTIEFVTLTEQWTILDNSLVLFKTAFSSGLHDVRQAWGAYSPLAMRLLPVEDPSTKVVFPWSIPEPEKIEYLRRISDVLLSALDTLQSFTFDFQVETQNLLLGEMFDNVVPRRQPIDPRSIVLRLDRAAELERYFKSPETSSGRSTAQAEANARASAESAGGS